MLLYKCCIDVGLKNLAMCITTSEASATHASKKRGKNKKMNECTEKGDILHWVVDNLLSADPEKCHGLLKSGSPCTRNATYSLSDSFYCKTHVPIEGKPKKMKQTRVKDFNLQEIALFIIEYCNRLFETETFQMLKAQANVQILIELQPNCARKMMFVSNVLFTKFTEFFDGKSIRFVRASQKLNVLYTGPELISTFKGYKLRKWQSIQYTKWFLNQFKETEKWLAYLETVKKQDDLCDTFLMCLNK